MEVKYKIVRYPLIICTFFLIIFFSSLAQAATHYVSPSGSATWTNSTNINTPCSLSMANANADDNDIVYLRAGTYTTVGLVPAKSGSSGNVITFTAYPGENPVINGGGSRECILLYGKSYITIDNIDTINSNGNYAVYVNHHNYAHTYGITIQNSTFDGGGIITKKTSNLIIKDNVIQNTSFAALLVYGSGCSQTRVEGNTVSGDFTGTDAVTYHVNDGLSPTVPNGDYHIIKNNDVTSTTSAENCFDITSGDYIVLDGNTCTGAVYQPGIYIGHGSTPENSEPDNTVSWIRVVNNKVYDIHQEYAEQIHLGGNSGTEYIQILRNRLYGTGEYNFRSLSLTGVSYVRVFHNVMDRTDMGDPEAVNIADTGGYSSSDFILKNNIFVLSSGDYAFLWESLPNSDMRSDYNLFWNTSLSPGADIYNGTYKTLSAVQSNYLMETNSAEVNPDFKDLNGNDYTLTNVSPAIDAGGFLTTITSSTGSGTSFKVDDPLWFYDGWGIQGETGDIIKTQSYQTATITSINYSTGHIIVDESIGWTNGEGIALYYQGTRPDIGAWQYFSSGLQGVSLQGASRQGVSINN